MRGAGNRRARREGALKRMQENLVTYKGYKQSKPTEDWSKKIAVLERDIECTKKNLGISMNYGSPITSTTPDYYTKVTVEVGPEDEVRD